MEADEIEKMQYQFGLLKKLVVLSDDKSELLLAAHEIEKIIRQELPDALEKEAPPDLPALCFDLQEVYEQFEDFLIFRDLIGKNIVALGGGFSTGKSSFLNNILGENSDSGKRVKLLPVDTAASTAVPTYLLHADGQGKINAINMFDSRITDLTEQDVRAIGHDFEEDNPGVPLGQLIQRLFIATPLQTYENIAFLDTPGYSKPDSDTYSARTDEQIAFEQLNHSNFILWFVAGSLIPQSDIEFLKRLDAHIPKVIILNKADKVLDQGMDTYREVIQSIQNDLSKNGVQVEGVWGYTRSPRRQREIADDISAIRDKLADLNRRKTTSRFGHDFMKLFVECRKYYKKELSEEEARLERVNAALLLSDNEDVKSNLEDSRLALTTRIDKLQEAQENLETQKNRLFELIRKIAAKVQIDIPTPSELELAEENAADPEAVLARLMEKKGISEDPILVEKLKTKLQGISEEDTAMPGSVGYEKRLFRVLKEKL